MSKELKQVLPQEHETLQELKDRVMEKHNNSAITPDNAVDILHEYMEWRDKRTTDV
jgi:hypothetical protein